MFKHTILIEAHYEYPETSRIVGYSLFYNPKHDRIESHDFNNPNVPSNTPIRTITKTPRYKDCILENISVTLSLKKDDDIIASYCKEHAYENFPNKDLSLKDIHTFYDESFKNHQWIKIETTNLIEIPSPIPDIALIYRYTRRNIDKNPHFFLYPRYSDNEQYIGLGHPSCSNNGDSHLLNIKDKKYSISTSLEMSNIIRDSFKPLINKNQHKDIFSEHQKINLLNDLKNYSCVEFLNKVFSNEEKASQIQESIRPLLDRLPETL